MTQEKRRRHAERAGAMVSLWRYPIGSELGMVLQDYLQLLTQHDVPSHLQLAREECLNKWHKWKATSSSGCCLHHHGLLTLLAKSAHTLTSDQYRPLREAYQFCGVMMCEMMPVAPIDYPHRVLSELPLKDNCVSFFWRDELEREVVTAWTALIEMYKTGFKIRGSVFHQKNILTIFFAKGKRASLYSRRSCGPAWTTCSLPSEGWVSPAPPPWSPHLTRWWSHPPSHQQGLCAGSRCRSSGPWLEEVKTLH